MTNSLEIARQLAHALDHSDFKRTKELLDPECLYVIGEDRLVGPEAITASYLEADQWAQTNLDTIEYESSLSLQDDDSVWIEYLDRITHQGREHMHRCRQIVHINENGLVMHIEHVELPGEQERVTDYFNSVGVQRHPSPDA